MLVIARAQETGASFEPEPEAGDAHNVYVIRETDQEKRTSHTIFHGLLARARQIYLYHRPGE